jgi:hypothetical protein
VRVIAAVQRANGRSLSMSTLAEVIRALQEIADEYGPNLPVTVAGRDPRRPIETMEGVDEIATLIAYGDDEQPYRIVVLYPSPRRERPEGGVP